MRNILATTIALGAVLAASSAFAADAYNTGYQSSSYGGGFSSTAYDWNGFYAGVSAGYGWGDADLAVPGIDVNPAGLTGGVQAGVNFNLGGIVAGAETDINLSGIRAEHAAGATYTSKLDYYGTFRGRVGMAFDNVLPYVTAGLAYGGNTVTQNVGGPTFTDSKFHWGWTAGAGVEFAMTEAISVKGEYLYLGLGEQDYSLNTGIKNDVSAHTIRLGVNYKF